MNFHETEVVTSLHCNICGQGDVIITSPVMNIHELRCVCVRIWTHHSFPPLPPPPPALVGMLHLGIFIMLLLSGERNFGVRLNKPYTQKLQLPDIPKFNGSHADLLFLVSGNTLHYMYVYVFGGFITPAFSFI